jgi:universal stress protein A
MHSVAQALRSGQARAMQDTDMATAEIETKAKSSPQMLHLKKILVALDFSPPSKQAFKYAVKFAQEFGAELTLIHILKPDLTPTFPDLPGIPAFSPEELAIAKENLRNFVASTRSAGLKDARSTFRVGLAAHEIVEAAKDLDVDLIVIATHGYTGWKHFCIGSTAERVVRAAPCPVFVVREKEHEFI